MHHLRGFILLIVLVFLQIFALMGLYALTQASLSMKRNNTLWERLVNLRLADKILKEIETNDVVESNNCNIPMTPSSELAVKPEWWWQFNTCRDNLRDIRYYYAVESMGSDACATILNGDKGTQIAYY